MATAAKLPVPDIVGAVLLIPVADIVVGERLRAVDPVWAAALGDVMRVEGQRTPIEVCRLPGRDGWTLVAGAHRHAAARLRGLAYLKAIEVEADPAERIAREISENLWRRGLEPLERASFIANMRDLLRARAGVAKDASPQQIAADARWQRKLKSDAADASFIVTDAYGFTAQIAERLGLSNSAIERDLLLHQRIPAGLIAKLRGYDDGRGHPALRNAAQLRALAKLDERQQTAAIDRLLWDEREGTRAKPLTLAEAIAVGLQRHNRSVQPEDKRLSAFIGAFNRMGLAEKKGALDQLAGMLPVGLRRSLATTLAGDLPEQVDAARLGIANDALREAQIVLASLVEGAVEVTDAMLASALAAIEDAREAMRARSEASA